MAAGAQAGTGAPPRVAVAVGVCALVYFLDGLVHTIMGPLAPQVAPALHLSNAELGSVFSANLLGQCVGLVLLPPVAARWSDRWVVGASLAGFGAMQLASAFATGAESLFLLRFATGVFLGGCLPSCLALVTAAAPPQRRGLAITAIFTGYGLGATVAGLVAGAFALWGGWRMAMAAVGAGCLVSALVSLALLADVPRSVEGEGASTQVSPLALLSARYRIGTLLLWLTFVALLIISYCLSSWLPVLLVQVGRDPAFAALAVSTFQFGGMAAALLFGVLMDRVGTTPVLVSALVLATGLLFAAGLVIETASTAALLALLAASGFFAQGAYGAVNVVLASFYPPRLRSTGIGWAKSVGRIGTFVAPILIGLGLSAGMAQGTVLSWFAAPAALSALALAAMAVVESRARAD
jgi:MFS family permease